jgi:hypothetical protein
LWPASAAAFAAAPAGRRVAAECDIGQATRLARCQVELELVGGIVGPGRGQGSGDRNRAVIVPSMVAGYHDFLHDGRVEIAHELPEPLHSQMACLLERDKLVFIRLLLEQKVHGFDHPYAGAAAEDNVYGVSYG